MLSFIKWDREIVAKRVAILAVVVIVLSALVSTHTITPEWSAHVTTWVTRVLDLLAAIGAIAWIRPDVTPADPALNPMSVNGVPLVEHTTE
jgi:hypothetical protein